MDPAERDVARDERGKDEGGDGCCAARLQRGLEKPLKAHSPALRSGRGGPLGCQHFLPRYPVPQVRLDTATCDSFTTPSDAYWDAVLACPQCTLKGCGYCKTSLRVCQWRVLYY